MCLVEVQQVGQTWEDQLTNVESHGTCIARLAVDYVVTHLAALSTHTHMHTHALTCTHTHTHTHV